MNAIGLVALAATLFLQASTAARPKAEADSFLDAIDKGSLRKTYREQVGQLWKKDKSEEAWVAIFSMLRQQKGGAAPSERKVIDERAFDKAPMTGQVGTYYFFRYLATYGPIRAYEDVYLEKESDGKWRIVGFFGVNAPD